ncbi:MAG: cell division protein ZapA [Desulfotalea sp.]
MSDEERLVQVELLGQQFSFYTAESEDSMEQIFDEVRSVLGKDYGATGKTSLAIAQRAILGCLTIASEHVKLKNKVAVKQSSEQNRIGILSEQISLTLGKD